MQILLRINSIKKIIVLEWHRTSVFYWLEEEEIRGIVNSKLIIFAMQNRLVLNENAVSFLDSIRVNSRR